jgi:MoaA/NifB/PqqE/SkfB family radical SAM enzyme
MCDIWKANHERRELTPSDLEPHIANLRDFRTRRVVLSGGEALMHANLWTLCDLIRSTGARITLLSTGLLLNRHATSVTTWCDDVIVSVDGPPSVHDEIRGVAGAFNRLAEGVAALKAARPGFKVTARCVVQRRNFRHLPDTIAAVHNVGLDGVSFLAADVSTEAFNRPEKWDDGRVSDVALNPMETEEFGRVLDDTEARYAADFAGRFIAESPAKLRRLQSYFAALAGIGDFPETRCNAPWVSAVVEADGAVRPCFFHRSLGNVRERPLSDILNSVEAIAFRRSLDVKTDPICRKCVCTLDLGLRASV